MCCRVFESLGCPAGAGTCIGAGAVRRPGVAMLQPGRTMSVSEREAHVLNFKHSLSIRCGA